eukprot:4489920-Pleurochrysis_carterae.AAC.1
MFCARFFLQPTARMLEKLHSLLQASGAPFMAIREDPTSSADRASPPLSCSLFRAHFCGHSYANSKAQFAACGLSRAHSVVQARAWADTNLPLYPFACALSLPTLSL